MIVEELLDDLVRAEGPSLLRLAWALTGDEQAARDLVQDCLVKVVLKWRQVSTADNPGAYARKILLNVWRDGKPRPRRDALAATTRTEAYESVIDRTVLVAAMNQLSPQQRRIVALRFFDDQSVEQTASLLGCSAQTVTTQTGRAIATLRTHPQLQCYLPETGDTDV